MSMVYGVYFNKIKLINDLVAQQDWEQIRKIDPNKKDE